MTPLLSALLAGAWLALISAYFWWRGILANRELARARPGPGGFRGKGIFRAGRP